MIPDQWSWTTTKHTVLREFQLVGCPYLSPTQLNSWGCTAAAAAAAPAATTTTTTTKNPCFLENPCSLIHLKKPPPCSQGNRWICSSPSTLNSRYRTSASAKSRFKLRAKTGIPMSWQVSFLWKKGTNGCLGLYTHYKDFLKVGPDHPQYRQLIDPGAYDSMLIFKGT